MTRAGELTLLSESLLVGMNEELSWKGGCDLVWVLLWIDSVLATPSFAVCFSSHNLYELRREANKTAISLPSMIDFCLGGIVPRMEGS